MKKRITALLLSFCVLLGALPVIAQADTPTVSLSHSPVTAGDVVEVTLDMVGCNGFVNLGLELTYDPSIMTLMKVDPNPSVGATCTTAQSLDKNPFNIGWDSIANTYFNGRLATFFFQVAPHVPEGTYKIELNHYKGRNGNYTDGISVNYDEKDNPLRLSYADGSVHVLSSTVHPPSGGGGGGGGGIDETTATASLSSAAGNPGKTVSVTLDLKNNTGFANLGLEVTYDRSSLTLLSVQENTAVGATFTPAQTLQSNPYNLGWDSVSDVTFNGRLATLTFKISESALPGVYPLQLGFYRGRNGDYIDGISVNYDEEETPLGLCYRWGNITVSYPPVVCPEATEDNTYGSNIYMALDRKMSYAEAKRACEDAGGHLATVTSAKENAFVRSLCAKGTYTQYYLGATNTDADGIWRWVNHENFVYSNWSGYGNGNSYLAMDTATGTWIPVTDYAGIGFVCEWEGESPSQDSTYWVEFISQKGTYAIGEDFEVSVWLYTNDAVIRLYDTDYTVSGFDSSVAGMNHVIVSYGEYSQVFDVEVVDTQPVQPPVTHIVQSLADEGATISPAGYSEVTDGTVMRFVIGTKEGYSLEQVSVNGESVTLADSNLTVTVTENTVIEVLSKKKTYTISQTVHGNGSIVLTADNVDYGTTCTAKIIADAGHLVSDVLIDGKSVGACKLYTFTNIKENHTITAVFEELIQTRTVKATASKGGRVYPAKSVVNHGSGVTFTITPEYGYHPDYALINGVPVEIVSNILSLDAVTEDTDISVVFAKDVYTVSAMDSEGVQLSVQYNGESTKRAEVPYQGTATIVLDMEEGYKLNTLYVNNAPVKPTKAGDNLVYRFAVTRHTTVSARCGLTLVSQFQQEVAKAGLAAEVNASNARAKKEVFTALADAYTALSPQERTVCTSAYATVLAGLDRANAYLALEESNLSTRIAELPEPKDLYDGNYRAWKDIIDAVYTEYENLTYLSKSFLDYGAVSKLLQLRTKAEELNKASQHILSYLYELIEAVPDGDNADTGSLSAAYAKLLLAEDTYSNLSETDRMDVSEDWYNQLIAKHGKIATQIQRLYVTPFTGKVLRCVGVNATDTIADAESKRVAIYDLMNAYHGFPSFVQEQISAATVQKLNSLYESASIKVSATVNQLPVDMNGDFDEDVDLVLTEPELDDTAVANATGKSLYQAIDVKMYAGDEEVQPTSKIRIKMEISKELSSADVSVVYIDDDGMMFDVQGEVIEESGTCYVVFFIDHFSSFAVLYNQETAPDARIQFDSEYVEIGSVVTATLTGVGAGTVYMAGYADDGAVTFVTMGNGSASAMVAEDTETVKAMVWDKTLAPTMDAEIISVIQ